MLTIPSALGGTEGSAKLLHTKIDPSIAFCFPPTSLHPCFVSLLTEILEAHVAHYVPSTRAWFLIGRRAAVTFKHSAAIRAARFWPVLVVKNSFYNYV